MTKLIFGTTKHVRFLPAKHQFSYPIYMLEVDIHKLDSLNDESVFLGYNKRRLLSIADKDYLKRGKDSLADKVQQITDQFQFDEPIFTVKMISIPRFLLNTFKPVSFYLLYSKDQKRLGFFAEVTNTYKESTYYALDRNTKDNVSGRYMVNKDFHVSPFFDEVGQYSFKVIDNSKRFEMHINYEKDNKLLFYANFEGKKKAVNIFQILKLVFFYPFTAILVFPRILFQAFVLYFIKKLDSKKKPIHQSAGGLRYIPTSKVQKIVLDKAASSFAGFCEGLLTLKLPDQTILYFGSSESLFKAEININSFFFFKSIRRSGEIGFGESYMKGEWDSPDLTKSISFMIMNIDRLLGHFEANFFIEFLNYVKHKLKFNSYKNSPKNISKHYDLGNRFYTLFLDKTMMYSSGLFLKEHESLTSAQHNKVDRLVDGLNLSSKDTVLEIGTGWGFVASKIAKKYGCKVRSVTLSKEQRDYASQLCREEGVGHLVSVEIIDYRDVRGSYDAVLSIEMIEAVGHEFLKIYFEQCNHLLKPGGRFALQVITYPNHKYKRYCKESDFIKKHIFPGGHLPSLEVIDFHVNKHTELKEISRLNIAESYSKTLGIWKQAFITERTSIMQLGFDEVFFRKWVYYFSYCQAAFELNYIGCYQLHYEKVSNDDA